MNKTERIREINELMKKLQAELCTLNPYAGLKSMGNKEFGESWSEKWIIQHCPAFVREDGKGYDFRSENLGKVEVKSSRVPNSGLTFNQVHPYDCDYFLFVVYNTEEGTEELFLFPSKAIFDGEIKINAQHVRPEDKNKIPECGTISGTKKNMTVLEEKYKISSWEELNGKA